MKSPWQKFLSLGLAAMILAPNAWSQTASPWSDSAVTFVGPDGKDGGYMEEIIDSSNKISFRICDSSAASSCHLLKDDAGKTQFTSEDLHTSSTLEYGYAAAKGVQDATAVAVVTVVAWKNIGRPLVDVAKIGGSITALVWRNKGKIIIGTVAGGIFYAPETSKKIANGAVDLVIDGAHYLTSNSSDRLAADAQAKADQLLSAARDQASSEGVPSVSEMATIVNKGRDAAGSAIAASEPFLSKYADPRSNFSAAAALDKTRDSSITTVQVPNLARFIRDLENGVSNRYSTK